MSHTNKLEEAFNKPLPTEEISDDTALHQMGEKSAAKIGGSNYKMFKIPNAGYIVQFDKDNATEVHHIDDSLGGGYKQSSSKSAMGFASTMAHHVKSLLDDGKTVRIAAHKDLAPNFRSMTDHLIKRNPEYVASEPTETKHELTGKPLVSWEIKKSLNEALSSSAHKAMATKASNKAADGLTNAQRISKDVMPTDRINIPLERSLTPDKDVVAYLGMKGYKIHDYEQGLAYHESNPDRKFRIGRVLNQIDAPQPVKTAYEKDPARQGINATNVSVVISRHPYDVAAMSTHQKWQSCQTLGGKATVTDSEGNKKVHEQEAGLYKEMVPGIINSGAHIAYLVHHPDDINKHYAPIARVTLNPFVSHTGHTILRPSEEYGDHWEGFHSTVKKWAESNFPAQDALYIRHSKAYPEGEDTISNYDPKFNEFWKNQHDPETLKNHPDQEVLHHHANKMISDKAGNISALISNKNLNNSDVDRLISTFAKDPRKANDLAKHARTPEQIQKVLDSNLGSFYVAKAATRNDHTTSEQLHNILDTYGIGETNVPGIRKRVSGGPSEDIVTNVMRHKNADESHYNKLFDLAGVKSNDILKKHEDFVDYMDAFHTVARKYHSEEIGKKLATMFKDAPVVTHNIVHDIATKHPHLIADFTDSAIADGLSSHPNNKNLQKIALERNTTKTLVPLARSSEDVNLLKKLEQHPSDLISRLARTQLIFLDNKT